MALRHWLRGVKYSLFPPKYNIAQELAKASREYEASLHEVASLRPEQQDYLARTSELEDPLTDGIECEGGH